MTSPWRVLISLAALVAAFLAIGARAAVADGTLTADQAAQDARILQQALKELHPALTKYRSAAEMDAAFARFDGRASGARSATAMYLAASELAAAIRCGHTWTNVYNQEGAIKAALLESADKLPLRITLVGGRWLVLASADPAVAAGDEILAIDGVPGNEVVARLMPYLRADGSSDGKRLRQLSHDRDDYSQMDILWPLLSPPRAGHYQLQVQAAQGAPRSVRVRAMTLDQREAALRAQGVKAPDDGWRFRITGDVATLTLPTFSFQRAAFDWAAFLDASFTQLEAAHVPALVIDLRANEGGDSAVGEAVLAHLLRQPYAIVSTQTTSAYERVPYALARYLDTWDFSFFDRTGQVEKITTGTAAGKYRVLRGGEASQTLQPAAVPYRGRSFLLVGPENSSAGFQFAKMAQEAGVATLVGQRTGGNLRGLNGGQLLWVVLPNSGVAVDIPLLAGAYTEATPDASVTPDVEVAPTLDDLRAGRDLEMEAVQRLVALRR